MNPATIYIYKLISIRMTLETKECDLTFTFSSPYVENQPQNHQYITEQLTQLLGEKPRGFSMLFVGQYKPLEA